MCSTLIKLASCRADEYWNSSQQLGAWLWLPFCCHSTGEGKVPKWFCKQRLLSIALRFSSAYISILPSHALQLHAHVSNRLAYYHHKGWRVSERAHSLSLLCSNYSSTKVSRAEPTKSWASPTPPELSAHYRRKWQQKKKRQWDVSEQCSHKRAASSR